MIISSTNLQEIRNQIVKVKKASPEEQIIVKAIDEDFNRKVMEIKGVNVLLSPELGNRKDKLKQRDSGLNEFLCKLAAKNNIKIGIDIKELQKLDKKDKARTLARIIQNIELCKRTKTQIILYPENKYKKQDIMAFITTLKGSTEQGKIR
ncbi:Ribonuclease P protein component 3 [uncultured archaeon]|nr:Ribonuclease P protein component 3 [uncultured archaeon]